MDGNYLLLFLGAGILIIQLITFIFCYKLIHDIIIIRKRKKKCVKETTGSVVSVRKEEEGTLNVRNAKIKSNRYFVTVNFEDNNGILRGMEYLYPFYEKIPNQGDPINVLYNPSNPQEILLPIHPNVQLALSNKGRRFIRWEIINFIGAFALIILDFLI